MPSGVISSRDGVARPPQMLYPSIIQAKRERLKRQILVERVKMTRPPRSRPHEGVLLLPGEEPFKELKQKLGCFYHQWKFDTTFRPKGAKPPSA